MKTIDDYIDLAIAKRNYKSDRQLGVALGFKSNTVNQWRTKRAWPSDEAMVRLADLCFEEKEQALLDLNIWRTQGKAREYYKHISEQLQKMAVVFLLIVSVFLPAQVKADEQTMYNTSTDLPLYILCDKLDIWCGGPIAHIL